MKKYQLFLNGRNFLINMEGKPQRHGFYTTRWVEAENPDDAELKAVENIKADSELKKCVLNDKDDPPMIYLEEIYELDSFNGVNPPGKGFSFYLEDSEK